MSSSPKTAIVTGASQGIGAGIVKGFIERGFNVVANSRKMTQSTEVAASDLAPPLIAGVVSRRPCAEGQSHDPPQFPAGGAIRCPHRHPSKNRHYKSGKRGSVGVGRQIPLSSRPF